MLTQVNLWFEKAKPILKCLKCALFLTVSRGRLLWLCVPLKTNIEKLPHLPRDNQFRAGSHINR